MRAVSHSARNGGVPGSALLSRESRDCLVYGMLWGLAVWMLETTAFAITRDDLAASWSMLVALAVIWCTRGAALAWVTCWLAARLRPLQAWSLFPVIAILLSLTWDGFGLFVVLSRQLLHVNLPQSGQFLFTLWPMLVYGALLFAFCMFDVRARHARALLAQAEAARLHSARNFDAARLEVLARRTDPQLLLRSLEAVRQAVADGDARAGTHLDTLVDFLRATMSAVRSTHLASTPGADTEVKPGGSNEQQECSEC